MIKTPISQVHINEDLPKKLILIFNGVLEPKVAGELKHINDFNRKHKEPIIEYWDINRLAQEIDKNLLESHLINNPNYEEETEELIISVKENDFSRDRMKSFIDKNYEQNQNETFRLIIIFILRRAEIVDNVYAFFYFMEYLLIRVWSITCDINDIEKASNFDTLNAIYLDELKKWSKNLSSYIKKEYGLYADNSGPCSEISAYPLRTFNIIKRISYIILNEDNKEEKGKYLELLLRTIENNRYAVSMPLCEFNFNDVGLAMIILYLEEKKVEARTWLFGIIENLILHFSLNYKILPLGKDVEDIPMYILRRSEGIDLNTIISILLEFTYIFDAVESYHMLKVWITNYAFQNSGKQLKELLLPEEKYESELYSKDILNSIELPISFSGIWERDKRLYYNRIKKITREYSFIKHNRIYVLVLLSSIYKDRIIQEIWRVFTKKEYKKYSID